MPNPKLIMEAEVLIHAIMVLSCARRVRSRASSLLDGLTAFAAGKDVGLAAIF
jgi:hypothetical protein